KVELGAQAVSGEESGAHTGEISARMLAELGASHVLVGHSERRAKGETDADVNRAVRACLANGLVPIVCVGESRAERDAGRTDEIAAAQVRAAFEGVSRAFSRAFIAYEPVWAIGSGDPCPPEEAARVHRVIRE